MYRRADVRIAATVAWLAATCFAIGSSATGFGQQRWPHEARMGDFRIYSDGPLDTLEPLLVRLALLEERVQATLELPPRGGPIHIYVFRDAPTLQAYLAYYFPRAPRRPALFIQHQGHALIYVHRNDRVEEDLYHEATHAILHRHFAKIPLWLDEGLAEYFERLMSASAVVAEDTSFAQQPNPVRRPLRTLETWTSLDQMGAEEYDQAWLWVRHLLDGSPTARRALCRYLKGLQDGGHQVPLSRQLQLAELLPMPLR